MFKKEYAKGTYVRELTPLSCETLQATNTILLCPEDIYEITAPRGFPEEAWRGVLHESCRLSDRLFAGYVDGNIEVLCGICLIGDQAVPWLLSSGIAQKKVRKIFWRASKDIMEIFESYKMPMSNVSWSEHKLAHKWLERLGFTFANETIKSNGVDMRYFYKHGEEIGV